MGKKHVLIVDDSKDLLFLLQHSVKRLGPEYEVSTAEDGPAALARLQEQHFDLVLTDYMMPGMSGMELVQEVRRLSPGTQVILMTAHDTVKLRDRVEDMQLGGYVGKPFSVPEILEIVERVMTRATQPVSQEPVKTGATKPAVYDHLKTLYNKTGAHFVVLLNSEGRPLQVVGQATPEKVSRLASFVAANFLAVAELATLLGDNSSIFKSSYHEGNNYNIYAHDITGEFLLAVVFGTADKPGTVWFYTRQTATALVPLLQRAGKSSADDEDKNVVADEFHSVLGDEAGDHQ